jgi:colicin import membrane protein
MKNLPVLKVARRASRAVLRPPLVTPNSLAPSSARRAGTRSWPTDRAMSSELDELKTLLDAKTPPAAAPGTSSVYATPTRDADATGHLGLDVSAIMRRFDTSATSLDTPPRASDRSAAPPLSPAAKIASALKSYDAQVANAEADVERLGAVMDDAERALDAALARNRTLAAAARSRKDDEMSELRAALDAKDRAIDSLRETLTATRRALESRITVAEDALDVRDAELRRASDQAAADRRDKREAESRAKDEAAACERAREETRRAEAARDAASEEATSATQRLETERRERERLVVALREGEEREAATAKRLAEEQDARKETQRKLDKYRRRHARDKEALAAAIATAAGTGTGTGTGTGMGTGMGTGTGTTGTTGSSSARGDLAKRLDAEQKTREASERLLQAELNSREDMEALFVSLRDVALRPNDNAAAIASLREELAALRAAVGAGAGTGTGTSALTSPVKKKKGFF